MLSPSQPLDRHRRLQMDRTSINHLNRGQGLMVSILSLLKDLGVEIWGLRMIGRIDARIDYSPSLICLFDELFIQIVKHASLISVVEEDVRGDACSIHFPVPEFVFVSLCPRVSFIPAFLHIPSELPTATRSPVHPLSNSSSVRLNSSSALGGQPAIHSPTWGLRFASTAAPTTPTTTSATTAPRAS